MAALLATTVAGCGGDGSAPPPPSGTGILDAAPMTHGPDAAADGPVRRGTRPRLPPADVAVVLPYGGPMAVEPIDLRAKPGKLDVHFSVDTTGSFAEEIAAMQADLERRIIASLDERIDDVAFGVSRFEDFPLEPFGAPGDRPFELLTAVTTERRRIASAVAALDSPLGVGGDLAEAGAEALWQIATGAGHRLDGRTVIAPFDGRAAPGGGTAGGVGFRHDAMKLVVHITDAPTHTPGDYGSVVAGTHGLDDAAAALGILDARVVGIASGSPARPHLEQLALATGAAVAPQDGACASGIDGAPREPVDGRCPLVFDIRSDGTGLSDAIVDALAGAVDAVRWEEVYGVAHGDRLGFVEAIEAVDATAAPGQPAPDRADRRPPDDGIADTFVQVRAGSELSFAIRLRNRTIRPSDEPQRFRVRVEVRGEGHTLTERVIAVTVPSASLDAGRSALDAGVAEGGTTPAGHPEAGTDAGTPEAGTE